MADEATRTSEVPKDCADRLTALAESTGRSPSLLASEALTRYLSVEEWQVAAIREAVEAADAGAPMVDHEDVVAWVRSWGTDNELPRPGKDS